MTDNSNTGLSNTMSYTTPKAGWIAECTGTEFDSRFKVELLNNLVRLSVNGTADVDRTSGNGGTPDRKFYRRGHIEDRFDLDDLAELITILAEAYQWLVSTTPGEAWEQTFSGQERVPPALLARVGTHKC